MERGDGALSWSQSRDLSQLVHQLCQEFSPGCDRICGAAPGYSSHAEPHHGTDWADETRELQADPGRALLRPEDSQQHWVGDWSQGACVSSLCWGRETGKQLFRTLRLRYRSDQEGTSVAQRETMEILPFLLWPFMASLILTGIHAYLGVHVVERGVIFVDLALAQIAALGATVAILAGM